MIKTTISTFLIVALAALAQAAPQPQWRRHHRQQQWSSASASSDAAPTSDASVTASPDLPTSTSQAQFTTQNTAAPAANSASESSMPSASTSSKDTASDSTSDVATADTTSKDTTASNQSTTASTTADDKASTDSASTSDSTADKTTGTSSGTTDSSSKTATTSDNLAATASTGSGKSVTQNGLSSGAATFNIHVTNKCSSSRQFVGETISSTFQATKVTSPLSLNSGESGTFVMNYKEIGLRISAHAELDAFTAQTLAEFGYSANGNMQGTFYNLSLMAGSVEGLQITPINQAAGTSCGAKTCSSPTNCPADQGWTDPNQTSAGSPADTGCIRSVTGDSNVKAADFNVVFCP